MLLLLLDVIRDGKWKRHRLHIRYNGLYIQYCANFKKINFDAAGQPGGTYKLGIGACGNYFIISVAHHMPILTQAFFKEKTVNHTQLFIGHSDNRLCGLFVMHPPVTATVKYYSQ
jgi:hypothetical protein